MYRLLAVNKVWKTWWKRNEIGWLCEKCWIDLKWTVPPRENLVNTGAWLKIADFALSQTSTFIQSPCKLLCIINNNNLLYTPFLLKLRLHIGHFKFPTWHQPFSKSMGSSERLKKTSSKASLFETSKRFFWGAYEMRKQEDEIFRSKILGRKKGWTWKN